jgi:hypothetical protein
LIKLKFKRHEGVVFDRGWGSVLQSYGVTYLYYTERDAKNIGLAFAHDGKTFKIINKQLLSPNDLKLSYVATPAVTKIGKNKYLMIFSASSILSTISLYYAISDKPEGPFQVLGKVIKPSILIEGPSVDNGASITNFEDRKFLFFYSNTYKNIFDFIRGSVVIRKVYACIITLDGERILRRNSFLMKLNGDIGTWNESVFCPALLKSRRGNFLFFAASRYSSFPYYQFIGYTFSPTAITTKEPKILISSIKEKEFFVTKDHLALDMPSPIEKDDELLLYYSILDRAFPGQWKTALSIYEIIND